MTGVVDGLVVSLDLHANVTPQMMKHADALIAYRTYPHVDMADTGTPSSDPVNVRYSRLKATSFAPSRYFAINGVRPGSPGTST